MARSRDISAPSDGEVLGSVIELDAAVADDLVGRARRALPGWRRTPPHERALVLRSAADQIRDRANTLGLLHAAESGKVRTQANKEVLGAAGLLDANAEVARTGAGYLAPTGALPGGQDDLTFVERVPLGVVVCVIPFNFPVELTAEKAGAAIAAGNVAIVKPPPQNPLATIELLELLQQTGLPDGVLQIAPGGTELSAALCTADGVDAVSLTGSVGAGVAVAEATARLLRPLHLELGGNGASIVLPDADLDHVVAECLRGRLLMNGQACAATKRIITVGGISDELTQRLEARLAQVVMGDPRDEAAELGHLIDAGAASRVQRQVDHAVDQGGVLVRGGDADGPWFRPALLTDVPAGADVTRDDEIFGPVFTVVPAADEVEAVTIANGTKLALTGAVFSDDVTHALAVAEELEVGGVVVNGTNNYRPPIVPFGGVGLAGTGREGIGYTYEELTRTRFVAIRGLRGGQLQGPATESADG